MRIWAPAGWRRTRPGPPSGWGWRRPRAALAQRQGHHGEVAYADITLEL